MLCHRYAPKPLLYHKKSFNKKVCRYIEESIALKKFGIGPHGATWDPDLLSAARWWCVSMAIEYIVYNNSQVKIGTVHKNFNTKV